MTILPRFSLSAVALLAFGVAACGESQATGGCHADTECIGGRLCVDGACADQPAGVAGRSSGGGSAGAPQTYGPMTGSACMTNGELRCGVDGEGKSDGSILLCSAGRFNWVSKCPGLEVCEDSNAAHDRVVCGSSMLSPALSVTGAPCGTEGEASCTFDAAVMNECKQGTWVASSHCPPSSCVLTSAPGGGLGYACANGGQTLGDLCHSTAGAVTCSTDLGAILACQNGMAVLERSCQGAKCVLTQQGLTCQ